MSEVKGQMNARMRQRTGLLQLRSETARAETRGEIVPVEVSLERITLDEDIQVRVAGLDEDKVAQYAVVFEEGGEFPPVVVFRDPDTEALYLADGFHRVAAAEKAGLDAITAEVRPDGREAAIEYAEEANLAHGFALTTRDKRHIYERRWRRGHEWRNMSDGAVARILGVARRTIGYWRQNLEEEAGAGGQNCPPEERIGADGKAYPVARVQESNRKRAEERRQPSPRVQYVDGAEYDQTAEAWDEPALEYEEPEPPPLPGEAALYEAHGMTPPRVARQATPPDPIMREAILEALRRIERYDRMLLIKHMAQQFGTSAGVPAEALRALEEQGVVELDGRYVSLGEHAPQGDDPPVMPMPEVAEVLHAFLGLCATLGDQLADVRDGHQVIAPEYVDGVRDQVAEALDTLNGYESPDGQGVWVEGVVDLLESVRGMLEERAER